MHFYSSQAAKHLAFLHYHGPRPDIHPHLLTPLALTCASPIIMTLPTVISTLGKTRYRGSDGGPLGIIGCCGLFTLPFTPPPLRAPILRGQRARNTQWIRSKMRKARVMAKMRS